MENNEIKKQEIDQTMELDGSMMSVLNEMRKWTKFLAVMGFIGIGITIIAGFVLMFSKDITNNMAMQNSNLSPFFKGVFYIIMSIIYIFPVVFLNNFSQKMKTALYSRNHEELYKSFNYLRRHYKFIGILIIIYLLIIGAIIVGGGLMALVAGI